MQSRHNSYDQLGVCKAELPSWNAEFKFQAKSYFTGEGESIKFCGDGIGWNRENEGNVRTLGKKYYAFLKPDYIYFSCCYYFLKNFLYLAVRVFRLC